MSGTEVFVVLLIQTSLQEEMYRKQNHMISTSTESIEIKALFWFGFFCLVAFIDKIPREQRAWLKIT